MSSRTEIEARGQDVDDAIENGLERLGVNRADVTVEVVDAGSRGLLGIGARDAVVRLTQVGKIAPTLELEEEPEPAPPPQPVSRPEPKPEPKPAPPPVVKQEPVAPPEPEPSPEPMDAVNQKEVIAPLDPAELSEELAEEQEAAVAVVRQLIDRLQFDATVSASLTEPDEITGRQIPVVSVEGNDLGSLIGPRGDTLSSLQYVARLMVSHKIQHRAHFVVDVEGYRQRREKALARLAERMAGKVLKRGRAMSLEPMPPNERRIIHMTLREHEEVFTQSRGEGSRRRVRIIPK